MSNETMPKKTVEYRPDKTDKTKLLIIVRENGRETTIVADTVPANSERIETREKG